MLHSKGPPHIFKYSLQSLFLRKQSLLHSSILPAKESIINDLVCFSITMFSEANNTLQCKMSKAIKSIYWFTYVKSQVPQIS